MFSTYTAKYAKIKSGYMGQLVEWPEVVTEGKTLEDCRAMLQDALREMKLAKGPCQQAGLRPRF
jgi:predicted RNase H-like HicB family nuclease